MLEDTILILMILYDIFMDLIDPYMLLNLYEA